MSFNDTINTIINTTNANITTLQGLLNQFQHTTIKSSDDELYDAPTFEEESGIWTLKQMTANVGGLYVGCYKLPDNAINSFISSVSVVTYNAPSSPTAPATITEPGESPVDLTDIVDLEGQSFNSFCIRSTVAFEIEVRVTQTYATCHEWNFLTSSDGMSISIPGYGVYESGSGWRVPFFSGYNQLDSTFVFSPGITVPSANWTHIEIDYTSNASWFMGTGSFGGPRTLNPPSGTFTIENGGSDFASAYQEWLRLGAVPTEYIYCTAWRIYGDFVGLTFPTGENC